MKKYKFTKLQKELVRRMIMAGIFEECYLRVIDYLETEEQQIEMLEYLKQNPTVSNRQVAMKIREIIKK